MIYQVGAAATYAEAKPKLAWFDAPPDRSGRLPSLLGRFGRGNGRFDLYLAQYVDDRDSSPSLRQAFSSELAARDGLLARWAAYWSWRVAAAAGRGDCLDPGLPGGADSRPFANAHLARGARGAGRVPMDRPGGVGAGAQPGQLAGPVSPVAVGSSRPAAARRAAQRADARVVVSQGPRPRGLASRKSRGPCSV